jgi:hypothetical protein
MYKCTKCDNISSSEAINNNTISLYCINRKQRRTYVPIEKTKNGDRMWYNCPICHSNISRRGGWKDIDLESEIQKLEEE